MTIFNAKSASRGPGSPEVIGFYDKASGSCQYICIDPVTRKCALIDVVLDFNPAKARTSTEAADWALGWIEREGLTLEWVLDTHPHADHLMAASYLKQKTGAPNAIGEKVREIAALWRDFYNTPGAFAPEADFDRLFADGDAFKIGELDVRVMLSPGHTLGSVSYVVGDAIFAHDTFMQPDSGTARADFPGGSAAELYETLMGILELPDDFRIFIGHDYGAEGRDSPAWESTVREQKTSNKHLAGGVAKPEYVKVRQERDATLNLPDRMLHALQVNLRGGRLPEPEADGNSYFKIPANRF
jgi:glyoxylase-like metal-dependent hydrolase (beta-lactamase superfamily II)